MCLKVPPCLAVGEWSAMLNYMKKFALEILPSVAATVIGAYIVNHYISRPATNGPVAAAVAPAGAKKHVKPTDVANIPEPGVTAKGISERAMMEKSAAERPAEVKPTGPKAAEAKASEAKAREAKAQEAKAQEAKAQEAKAQGAKSQETRPAETAAIPAEARRHAPVPAPHEKAIAKAAPAPVAASPAAPVQTAVAPVPAAEDRDVNELARAAIERLRNADSQSRTDEASRSPEAPRLQEVPRTVTPPPTMAAAPIRPLPPPITVAAPPVEGPTATASISNDDPNRPVPPADIPPPPPAPSIGLRAGADKLANRTTNMAQDMLHAARAMLHAVLPGADRQDSSNASQQFTD